MKNYTFEKLKFEFDKLDWANVYDCTDPDDCWSLIYNKYVNCLEKVAPFIEVSTKKDKSAWVTSEIIDLIRSRDKNKEKADSLRCNKEFINFKANRNKIKRLVIKAKKNIYYIQIK